MIKEPGKPKGPMMLRGPAHPQKHAAIRRNKIAGINQERWYLPRYLLLHWFPSA